MAFKFFTVPIRDAVAAEEGLNAFVHSHRVLSIERQWVEVGGNSFWSCCVDYLEGSAGASAVTGGGRRGKVDYKEVLAPEQFAIFSKLRDLRKEIAQAEAVPVYTVFTNEQLAQMVQDRAQTKADLEKIAGVGDARVEKYADKFLPLLAAERGTHEAPGESVVTHS